MAAKTDRAHTHLSRQFKNRHVQKEYLALVHGAVSPSSGTIELPIGRHPVDRKRMSTVSRRGRSAHTQWTIQKQYQNFTLLTVILKTGRTHQIRVHCAAIQHPILGDKVYRTRKLEKTMASKSNQRDKILQIIQSAKRQMLHAWRLGFTHPHSGEQMVFESPLPPDMAQVIGRIREAGL